MYIPYYSTDLKYTTYVNCPLKNRPLSS